MPTGGGQDTGQDDPEAAVRSAIAERFGGDARVVVYGQGDSLDVHVQFRDLESTLSESLDERTVQQYSTLKFTVSRR
jgi:hypothetical protein